MTIRTLESLGDLAGKTVLIRCDFNVPLQDGAITDEGRIVASLPTLRAPLAQGGKVVAQEQHRPPHRPPAGPKKHAPVAQRLGELLGTEVAFAADTVGEDARRVRASLADGQLALLENLRFDARETSKAADERAAFAAELAEGADAFVSDGFGVVHREQASVVEIAQALPSAAGLLVQRELEVLSRLTDSPERPYAVVLGGSKVSDKLGVIEHLLPRVDRLLIGGGMLFTFLAAQGHGVASSLLEEDQLDRVRGYLQQAEQLGVELLLPTDVVVAAAFDADAEHETVAADAIDDSRFGASGIGLDIGPDSAAAFADAVRSATTVFWNGPMGVFEMPAFAHGTKAVAQALTETSGLAVVGGGDSAAAVRQLGFADDDFGHISTGGGASLEFLEGARLPGLEALGWEGR